MAKESQGVIAYWSTTSVSASGASNVIGEVVGFSGPTLAGNPIDVTNLVSTAKEKMMGVYDGGQVTLNLNGVVTNEGQQLLRQCLTARTKGNLMIQLSTAATTQKIAMMGYVQSLNITGSVDNVLKSDVTIAVHKGVTIST